MGRNTWGEIQQKTGRNLEFTLSSLEKFNLNLKKDQINPQAS
jgi:hypothetical protein